MIQNRFKFRAWDKVDKKMLYNVESTCIILDGVFGCLFAEILINPNYIVEQCTGLKDKDGKLIYEGDIMLEVNWGYKAVVYFDNTCGAFMTKDTGNCIEYLENCCGKGWQVIGNIHETPELLEEKDD
ncbi:MAG: YopX family protein [Staphylococcus sp.]|nr:YopX family protein [Staphylococcus sp.]